MYSLYVINPFPYKIHIPTDLDEGFSYADILLIGGRIGSGKTFIAKRMAAVYGVHLFHFAEGVKKLAGEAGWKGQKDEQGRKLLQTIGGAGRHFSSGYLWAKQVSDKIEELSEEDRKENLIVVDDFRYPEEYYYLSSRFANVYTMWVDMPSQSDEYKYKYWEFQDHESELALQYFKLWNFVFVNSLGDLEFLDNVLDTLMATVKPYPLFDLSITEEV